MIKTLIIDDEHLARELIKKRISHYPEFTVIGEASNGFDGYKLIQDLQPDLVFLDIQMPKITGFELLEMLEEKPVIIFATAYDEFAIKAFNENATDYLLKPFSDERFSEALEKAKEKLYVKNLHNRAFHYPLVKSESELNRLIVKETGRILIIPTEEIVFIEAQDDYALISTQTKKYLKKTTLKELEERLDKSKFFRIHRSYIVNVAFVDEIIRMGKDLYSLTIKNGQKLPVSKTGYDSLKTVFQLDD